MQLLRDGKRNILKSEGKSHPVDISVGEQQREDQLASADGLPGRWPHPDGENILVMRSQFCTFILIDK